MEYVYKLKDKISHGCGSIIPEGAFEVTNWKGTPGEPWEWYDKGIRISDENLVAAGLREDHRGTYYDENKQEHKISVLDKDPESSWTNEKWKHNTDKLDAASGKWIEDLEAREEYYKAIIRGKRTAEFYLFDKYQLPLPWDSLTQNQKDVYITWREAWLQAPETGVEPKRPDWFKV